MLRFVDAELNSWRVVPVTDYSTHQPLSLQETLEPIISRIDQLDQLIQTAKSKCHFPSEHGLTHDESAAIFLYTMEWDNTSLYEVIKKDLLSEDRSISQSWFLFLRLFDTAVHKLPSSRIKVWRGINEDISKNLKENDDFIWESITSCSSSDNIIKDCLESNSTLCLIEAVTGKDISDYSSSSNQKEVILCPGTRLYVVNVIHNQTSSPVLHLREDDRHASSFVASSNVVKTIPSRWYNHRIPPSALHFIVLITALSLVTIVGKSLSTFKSSQVIAVLDTPLFKTMQVILPSESSTGHTTRLDMPSNFHIEIDTFGNRYEGAWVDGKKHGQGKMYFANGYTYTGDWFDDMATGEGIFVWTNGDQYEGQMKDGQRHGKGSYRFASGDNYTGDWFEDKKSGYGISSLAAGKYEGHYKDDKMHGSGSFYFENGDIYTGDWIDDKQDGKGIIKWVSGDQYEGGFKAGKMHGEGLYEFANGNTLIGEWVEGERMADHGAITFAAKNRPSIAYSKICRHLINNIFVNMIIEFT